MNESTTPTPVDEPQSCDTGSEDLGRAETPQAESPSVKQEASHAVAEAKQGARRTAETVKAEAASVAGEVQSAVSSAAAQAKQEGSDFLQRQKERTAEELAHFEAAVRRASQSLREEHDDHLATYAEQAADRLSQLKDYLQRQDLPGLLNDVEDASRRRPELVFGGLFMAGLATARFLKASSRTRSAAQGRVSRRHRGPSSQYEYASATSSPTASVSPLHETSRPMPTAEVGPTHSTYTRRSGQP
jgi:hypothetical protein